MTNDKVTVRLLRQQDLPLLLEMDGMIDGAPRGDYLQGKARQALDSKHGMVISLVAEVEGRVAGFLMARVYRGEFGIPETVATVDTVGVGPNHQGHGIGQLLMEEFVSHVRKAGIERVRTMVDWNQGRMFDYFRAAGFAPAQSLVLERSV